jgi:hypothetical protein
MLATLERICGHDNPAMWITCGTDEIKRSSLCGLGQTAPTRVVPSAISATNMKRTSSTKMPG